MFFLFRVNQTSLRGETLHPIRIQVQLPPQVGTFPPSNNTSVTSHSWVILRCLCSLYISIRWSHLPFYFIFMSQGMEACRRLPITPPRVHLGTLHLEAWGGPMAGHLETERLKLPLVDPRHLQNHPLPLATAGTLDVPKDETGTSPFLSALLLLPPTPPPLPPSQPILSFLATYASILQRTACTSFTHNSVTGAVLSMLRLISLQSLHSHSHHRRLVQFQRCPPPQPFPHPLGSDFFFFPYFFLFSKLHTLLEHLMHFLLLIYVQARLPIINIRKQKSAFF